MKTAIVLLYGLFDIEREQYARYLDKVGGDIRKKNINKVILCGGFTDPHRPNLSEAATVHTYLREKLEDKEVILEEKSINTNQNLEFAAQSVSSNEDIIVYCDLARKAKVIWIALHFLLQVEKREIYRLMLAFAEHKDIYKDFVHASLTVKGVEYSKTKEELIAQTHASIIDVLALYDTAMENMDIEQRKKDFGLA